MRDSFLPAARSTWARVRAFVACRRCAVGWAIYLALAAVLVFAFAPP